MADLFNAMELISTAPCPNNVFQCHPDVMDTTTARWKKTNRTVLCVRPESSLAKFPSNVFPWIEDAMG